MRTSLADLPLLAAAHLALALIGVAATAPAAEPEIPGAIRYEGALLDPDGQPLTGPVDLTVRIHDQIVGGTLIYAQHFPATPLTDGVFELQLGPRGEAAIADGRPLTTRLHEALAGDVPGTAPRRFLELVVGGEDVLTRTQLLSVPFALSAAHATTADFAASAGRADVAGVATEAAHLGSLPAEVLEQIVKHVDFDGAPPSGDPREGLRDTDGDGIANFVDPDNDDDSISDADEVAAGSDINVVTPFISRVQPVAAPDLLTTTITIEGGNFDAGLSVRVGTQTLTPSGLGPDSFEVSAGPQVAGDTEVELTLANGERDTAGFRFTLLEPRITGVEPRAGVPDVTTRIVVTGANFIAPLDVQFGAQTLTPIDVTPDRFELDVGPNAPGLNDLTVTLANGAATVFGNAFEFGAHVDHGLLGATDSFALAIRGEQQTAITGTDLYQVDVDGDIRPDTSFTFPSTHDLAIGFDAAGTLYGVRCRINGIDSCDVELARDTDGDFGLAGETGTVIETVQLGSLGDVRLTFDPQGRPAVGYTRVSAPARFPQAVVAHDRDGNGDFGGPAELVFVEPLFGGSPVEIAVDPSGRVAFAYVDTLDEEVEVAYDRNGDGDFEDVVGGNAERQHIPTPGPSFGQCVGAGFAPDGDLVVVYGRGTTYLLRDHDADGDFDDAGERLQLASGARNCRAARGGGPVAVAVDDDDELRLFVDHDDDGDFDGVGENLTLHAGSVGRVDVAYGSGGQVFVATGAFNSSHLRRIFFP